MLLMIQRLVLGEASKSMLTLWKSGKVSVKVNLKSLLQTLIGYLTQALVSTTFRFLSALEVANIYCIHQSKFGVSFFNFFIF